MVVPYPLPPFWLIHPFPSVFGKRCIFLIKMEEKKRKKEWVREKMGMGLCPHWKVTWNVRMSMGRSV